MENYLEECAKQRGGYDKIPDAGLEYLRKKYKEENEKKIEDAEDKIPSLKSELEEAIRSIMRKYGYSVGSSEFSEYIREIADELDD